MLQPLFAFVLCLLGLAVQAQVYTGTSASGSVVLAGEPGLEAPLLLLEAERVPLAGAAAAAAAGATGDALQSGVPARYWPFIQEASLAYQIPSELIHAVILVESNYNPRAVSRKGAQGLMQLMPATAKRFGIANGWDPRQNILAGSKYLRWLMDYFGQDMELTVAAYNAGENAVLQAGRRIPRFAETEKYVPRVLSIYRRAQRPT